MTVPRRLLIPASLGAGLLVLPIIGLVLRAPLSTFGSLLTAPATLSALWLSVWTSTASTAVCVLLGVPLSWVLARAQFRFKSLLRGILLTPLVVPPVVAGVALLSAFGRNGFLGAPLRDGFGLSIPYTSIAVVLAHSFVAMPFFILSTEEGFRALPPRLEDVASTLGADAWTRFRRVGLPLARPALIAGAVLAWARSLGEFGATITFAGNYPGTTRTLPLEVYTQLQADPDAAIVVSLLLLIICVGVLAALRGRWLGGLR